MSLTPPSSGNQIDNSVIGAGPTGAAGPTGGAGAAGPTGGAGAAGPTGPTGPTGAADATGASSNATPGNPTAPSATGSYAMQGLAGAITPAHTGTVLVVISGDIVAPATATAGNGILLQLSYGTGGAPINAAGVTGTQVGAIMEYMVPVNSTDTDLFVPFSMQYVLSGLALHVAVWLDLAAESVATASAVGVANVTISAIEN